jgi:glucuronate isomerase
MDPARELEDLRSLLEAPSPAVLMTYRPDGSADVSPVWFRYTGEAFEVVVRRATANWDTWRATRAPC